MTRKGQPAYGKAYGDMNSQADISHTGNLAALEELQARPQWVCWRKEPRDKKLTKVPYNPRTGQWARSNDPGTWASYAVAKRTYEHSLTTKHPYDGIGYMFSRDITGIDLDHCINEAGTIDDWAQFYIKRFTSYSEISPSGEGIHILVHGTILNHQGRKRPIPERLQPRHAEAAIEMYDSGRFFTFTGLHLDGTPDTIEERSAILQAVYAEMTASRQQHSLKKHERNPIWKSSDDALLDKAMHAKNGTTFRALWNGDTSGYVSQSEAELALCNLLAFWTGNDAHQIDRLYRFSALYRPDKWDRPARSGETYGEGTIARAIASCTDAYNIKGKIIQFRRWQTSLVDEYRVQLPETDLEFALDCLHDEEEGDARLYAHLFWGKCIYDHTEGMWYEWRGHFWERDECKHSLLLASGPLASVYLDASAQLAEEVAQMEKHLDPDLLKGMDTSQERYQWLRIITSELIGRAKALKKLKRAQAVLTYAQAYLRITSREWDNRPWLLACTNGVLDLRTGDLHPGQPDDYLRTAIPTEWMGMESPCPRWEQFLQEIFEDKSEQERAELIVFLQRLLGYGITGSTMHHIFSILYGEEGRNGKDTLVDTLKDVLGPLVGAVSNDLFVAQDKFRVGGAPTPHLCDLQGKRLVWGSETRQGDKLNIAQIKLLSGGGDISARQLHGRQYTFTPTHKLLLMTNYKPHADARDKAFWSRACLIEFGIRFVEHPQASNERKADPHLKEKLKQERNGILGWLVKGCLAWQKRGLVVPSFILLATEKYRDEEDRILQFLIECCFIHPDASIKASVLYSTYKIWCEDNQFGRGMNATLFGHEMSRRFEKKTTKTGRIYKGIGLRTAGESGEGSVKEVYSKEVTSECPPQANVGDFEPESGEGCEDLHHVFSPNQDFGLYRGQNQVKPFTPFTNSSFAKVPESASKNISAAKDDHVQPFTDLSHARQYVETSDGIGYLTDNRQEQDVTFVAAERKERLRYKIGVVLLSDGVERFYYPSMVSAVQSEVI